MFQGNWRVRQTQCLFKCCISSALYFEGIKLPRKGLSYNQHQEKIDSNSTEFYTDYPLINSISQSKREHFSIVCVLYSFWETVLSRKPYFSQFYQFSLTNATTQEQPVLPLSRATHLTIGCLFLKTFMKPDLLHSSDRPFQTARDYLHILLTWLYAKSQSLRIPRPCGRPSHSNPPHSRC